MPRAGGAVFDSRCDTMTRTGQTVRSRAPTTTASRQSARRGGRLLTGAQLQWTVRRCNALHIEVLRSPGSTDAEVLAERRVLAGDRRVPTDTIVEGSSRGALVAELQERNGLGVRAMRAVGALEHVPPRRGRR